MNFLFLLMVIQRHNFFISEAFMGKLLGMEDYGETFTGFRFYSFFIILKFTDLNIKHLVHKNLSLALIPLMCKVIKLFYYSHLKKDN